MTKIQTLIALYNVLKPLIPDLVNAVKAVWAALQPFLPERGPLVGTSDEEQSMLAELVAAGIPESDAKALVS